MKKDIEKEVKEIMENKKKGCKREEKVIFLEKTSIYARFCYPLRIDNLRPFF